jgi:putative transposase
MGKPKKLMGVQQCLISTNKETEAILEYLCSESNKLNNCAVYYARQIWFKTKTFVTAFDLVKAIGSNKHL